MSRVMLRPGAPDVPAVSSQRFSKYTASLCYGSQLYVTGNLTETGGSSDPSLVEDAPWTFLTELQVKSRRGTYMKAAGEMLYHMAKYEQKNTAPSFSAPSVTGAGSHAWSMRVPIHHSPPDLVVPGALAALFRPDDEAQVGIQFGAATQLATGGDRVNTVDTLTVDLVNEVEDQVVTPDKIRMLEQSQKSITQAQNDLEINLNAMKGRETHRILVRGRLSGVRSNSAILVARLMRSSGQFYEAKWGEIQEANRRWLQADPPVGIAVIDFDANMHALFGLPKTENLANFRLQFQVAAPSGTSDVTVLVSSSIDDAYFSKNAS